MRLKVLTEKQLNGNLDDLLKDDDLADIVRPYLKAIKYHSQNMDAVACRCIGGLADELMGKIDEIQTKKTTRHTVK